MSENIVQSELPLDVSDGGDDVDDVVIVHLQRDIVPESDLILISAGVE